MKRAFNLIELIFVLVIIGILTSIAFYSFKPKHLQNDLHFAQLQINTARYEALNYDKRRGEEGSRIGCIDLNEINDTAAKEHYSFKSRVLEAKDICFNFLGEPLVNNTPIVSSTVVLRLRYKSQEGNISVLPKSGYVIIQKTD